MANRILIENCSVNGEAYISGIILNMAHDVDDFRCRCRNSVVIGNCTNGNFLVVTGNPQQTPQLIIFENNASEDASLPFTNDDGVPPTLTKSINNIVPSEEILSTGIYDPYYFKIYPSIASVAVNPDKGAVPLTVKLTPTLIIKKLADHGSTSIDSANNRDYNGAARPNSKDKVSIGAYEP